MAKLKLDDYVATAASNTDIGNISIDNDVMVPANVDNSFRELTAQTARYIQDTNGSRSTTGSSNAYVYASYGSTASKFFTAYYTGLKLMVQANHTNTGAATFNLDSLGNKAIRRLLNGAEAALRAGDIVADFVIQLVYDADANSGSGAFILLNPASNLATLGNDIDVNGFAIVSSANGDIEITPNGTGSIVLDGQNWPQADGSAGMVPTTDGAGQLAYAFPGFKLIDSWVYSSPVTDVEFTDLGDYVALFVLVVGTPWGTSGARARIQVSTDNGASYVTSGYQGVSADDSSSTVYSSGFGMQDGAGGGVNSAIAELWGFNASHQTIFRASAHNTTNLIDNSVGRAPAAVNNAFRYNNTAGYTITGGAIYVYGLVG